MVSNQKLSIGGFFTLLLSTVGKARQLAPAPAPLALWKGASQHDEFTAYSASFAPSPSPRGVIGLVRPEDSYLLEAFQRTTQASYRAPGVTLDLACSVTSDESFECTVTGDAGGQCVDGLIDQDPYADETHITIAPCSGTGPAVRFSHGTQANVPESHEVAARTVVQGDRHGFTVSYQGPASLVAFSASEEDGAVMVEGKIRSKTQEDVSQSTEIELPGFTAQG